MASPAPETQVGPPQNPTAQLEKCRIPPESLWIPVLHSRDPILCLHTLSVPHGTLTLTAQQGRDSMMRWRQVAHPTLAAPQPPPCPIAEVQVPAVTCAPQGLPHPKRAHPVTPPSRVVVFLRRTQVQESEFFPILCQVVSKKGQSPCPVSGKEKAHKQMIIECVRW